MGILGNFFCLSIYSPWPRLRFIAINIREYNIYKIREVWQEKAEQAIGTTFSKLRQCGSTWQLALRLSHLRIHALALLAASHAMPGPGPRVASTEIAGVCGRQFWHYLLLTGVALGKRRTR
jgi:hypothetical protein